MCSGVSAGRGTRADTSLSLLNSKYPLLPTIAGVVPFEIAIGLNGRVWFKTKSIGEGIAMKRVIEEVNEGSLDAGNKQVVERTLRGYLA